MPHCARAVMVALLLLAAAGCRAGANSHDLLLASTTSTQDSGLLDVLIPAFEEESGYTVKLIAGGSGQAIETARRGDADVLLVHSPDAEEQFVADGDGIERALVMYNRFVLVGPADDPAGVSGKEVDDGLRAIAAAGARFVSRGDDSGTHVAERELWVRAGVDPAGQPWYSESGQGQGATLQMADQQRAYALTDRGTFLAWQRSLDVRVVSERGDGLRNDYHVIVVNPERHRGVNVAAARAWAAFVTGPRGQEIIRTYGVEQYGEPLFTPAAVGGTNDR